VRLRCSERSDGDFHLERVDGRELEQRRRQLVDLPWSQPREVHGIDVAVVTRPGQHDGAAVDALVTALPDAVLGIWTADCAPVALDGGEVIGGVHAGWRGVLGGVLEATVEVMRSIGGRPRRAVLGPCIHPCCYEFGVDELERLADRYGPIVWSSTSDGRPALDLRAAVRAALGAQGVALEDRSVCTGCAAERFFSHRARRDRQRQVMAIWRASAESRA
jgi:YfiH family protein